MEMDLVQMITTLGFPAAVAAYALWVHFKHLNFLEQTLGQAVKDNPTAINELKVLIVKLIGDREEEHHEVRGVQNSDR